MLEKRYLFEIEYLNDDDVKKKEVFDGIKKSEMKEIVTIYMERYRVLRVKWDFLGY